MRLSFSESERTSFVLRRMRASDLSLVRYTLFYMRALSLEQFFSVRQSVDRRLGS